LHVTFHCPGGIRVPIPLLCLAKVSNIVRKRLNFVRHYPREWWTIKDLSHVLLLQDPFEFQRTPRKIVELFVWGLFQDHNHLSLGGGYDQLIVKLTFQELCTLYKMLSDLQMDDYQNWLLHEYIVSLNGTPGELGLTLELWRQMKKCDGLRTWTVHLLVWFYRVLNPTRLTEATWKFYYSLEGFQAEAEKISLPVLMPLKPGGSWRYFVPRGDMKHLREARRRCRILARHQEYQWRPAYGPPAIAMRETISASFKPMKSSSTDMLPHRVFRFFDHDHPQRDTHRVSSTSSGSTSSIDSCYSSTPLPSPPQRVLSRKRPRSPGSHYPEPSAGHPTLQPYFLLHPNATIPISTADKENVAPGPTTQTIPTPLANPGALPPPSITVTVPPPPPGQPASSTPTAQPVYYPIHLPSALAAMMSPTTSYIESHGPNGPPTGGPLGG